VIGNRAVRRRDRRRQGQCLLDLIQQRKMMGAANPRWSSRRGRHRHRGRRSQCDRRQRHRRGCLSSSRNGVFCRLLRRSLTLCGRLLRRGGGTSTCHARSCMGVRRFTQRAITAGDVRPKCLARLRTIAHRARQRRCSLDGAVIIRRSGVQSGCRGTAAGIGAHDRHSAPVTVAYH